MSGPHPHRPSGDRRALVAAAVAIVLLALAVYAAAWRELPFGSTFELRGEFTSSSQLRPGNPVRRAGVDIGRVTEVEAGEGHTSVVTMELDDPDHIHRNASLAVKPRLFFEGNFYVDVIAGTPAAPPLRDGETIPLERTSGPVQIDQVISTFTEPVRDALTGTVHELASGLGGRPGRRGSDELRRATRELDAALGDVETAARALQGTEAGDLHRAIGSSADVTGQLARDPDALAGMVRDIDRVAAALSTDPASLSASVRRLSEVLRVAPASLRELDRTLPVLTRFAEDLRPALRTAPPALAATGSVLRQLELASRPGELPSLVRDLAPLTASLPALQPPLRRSLEQLDAAAQCINRIVLPTLRTEVPDGANSTGRPAWHDILHLGANLLGASAGFDGNGGTLRLGLTEGANALQETIPGIGELVGNGHYEGVNPIWLGAGVQPEFRPDQWCKDQQLPDLGARHRVGTPVNKRVIPKRTPGPAERERRARLLSLLTGDDADRRELLRILLEELPGGRDEKESGRPGRGSEDSSPAAPSAPAPSRSPAKPAAPATPDSRPAPSPLEPAEQLVDGLLDAVRPGGSGGSAPGKGTGDAIEGLLGGLLGTGGGR